jgi:predicted transcriptional regulator
METDLYIAREDDLIELIVNMMDWKNVRSIPVENNKNELVGLISVKDLLKYLSMNEGSKPEMVQEIMHKDFVQVPSGMKTEDAVDLLAETRAGCLLVVDNLHIEGIVSESDIVQVANMTKVFRK